MEGEDSMSSQKTFIAKCRWYAEPSPSCALQNQEFVNHPYPITIPVEVIKSVDDSHNLNGLLLSCFDHEPPICTKLPAMTSAERAQFVAETTESDYYDYPSWEASSELRVMCLIEYDEHLYELRGIQKAELHGEFNLPIGAPERPLNDPYPWLLQCKNCNAQYGIGTDAYLIADEDVSDFVRSMCAAVVGAGERGPELAMQGKLKDKSQRIKALAMILALQRDLENGGKRQWYCNECRAVND